MFEIISNLSLSRFIRRRSEKPEMESEKYLPELMAERDTLDPSFRHSLRLLEQGKRHE